MTPEPTMPASVNLCGIRYRIQVHEGLIVFTEEEPVWSQQAKLSFQRKAGCWYVNSAQEYAPVSHVIAAFEVVSQVYGGNFKMRNGENEP